MTNFKPIRFLLLTKFTNQPIIPAQKSFQGVFTSVQTECKTDSKFTNLTWSVNIDTEFELGCSKLNALPDLAFYTGFVLSCFFGSFIQGLKLLFFFIEMNSKLKNPHLSDMFNRKWSWFSTQLLGTIMLGLQLTSREVYSYSLFRMVQGCLNLLFYNSYYVYVTELIEPRRRSVRGSDIIFITGLFRIV